jgi:hypothetical protein
MLLDVGSYLEVVLSLDGLVIPSIFMIGLYLTLPSSLLRWGSRSQRVPRPITLVI